MAVNESESGHDSDLVIGHLNIRGQTKFSKSKQKMIEETLKHQKLDILHIQEVNIEDNSFEECDFLQDQFQILRNNAQNGYGVCSLVRRDLSISNIRALPGGRLISFDIGRTRIGNVYLPSGSEARSEREEFCGKTIPELFMGSEHGCLGGDWNSITSSIDTTGNAEQKICKNLSKLSATFRWTECFRHLHPKEKIFSHVYRRQGAGGLQEGASRLDRAYVWGKVETVDASYIPVAYSDHWLHRVKVKMPEKPRDQSTKFRPYFKIKPEMAKSEEFKSMVEQVINVWLPAKEVMDILEWWDLLKADIREGAKWLEKEKSKARNSRLNFLMLHQTFLAAKVAAGEFDKFDQLKITQEKIKKWFDEKSEEIFLLAGIRDAAESETVRSYHFERLTRVKRRSSILKLKNKQGVIVEGHRDCAETLTSEVKELLDSPADLDQESQEELLEMVEKVFSEEDNARLEQKLTDEEIKQSIERCNRLSSPGSDGVCYSVYHHCWKTIGPHLCDTLREVVARGQPTMSQRHSYLVFSPKTGKEGSLLTKHLRRLSMIQTDLKLLSATLAERLKKSEARTLSALQFAAGPRRITHLISKARDLLNIVKPTDK